MNRDELRARLRAVIAAKAGHRGPECLGVPVRNGADYARVIRENMASHTKTEALIGTLGVKLLDVGAPCA